MDIIEIGNRRGAGVFFVAFLHALMGCDFGYLGRRKDNVMLRMRDELRCL